jgi:hypothetical protein
MARLRRNDERVNYALSRENRMKKQIKKLKLSRETVRRLSGPETRQAKGGIMTIGWDCTNNTTQTTGNCPTVNFCGTASCGDSCLCDNSQGEYICINP